MSDKNTSNKSKPSTPQKPNREGNRRLTENTPSTEKHSTRTDVDTTGSTGPKTPERKK